MPELPTGRVTFLFADVEGSTALQENPSVDYAAAVALLRRLLRDAVAAHGGAEADAVGDEYVAVFADPATGSWHHELTPAGEVASGTWAGQPDAYHLAQMLLFGGRPVRGSVAAALR